MAVQTIYILGTTAVTPNWWGNTQLNGSAPTAANSTYGWTVAKTAITSPYWGPRLGATALATGNNPTSYVDYPGVISPNPGTGSTNTTAGDSFVVGPLTGTFANTTWTFNWNMRASTAGAVGHIRMRVWRGTSANGSGATSIGGTGTVVGLGVTLSTTVDGNSSISWVPGAFTLNNEYLFFQVEWQETTAGSSNSSNVMFRIGTTTIVTADFSQNITGTLSVTENPDTISAAGTVPIAISGTLAVTEAPDIITATGNVSVVGHLAVTQAAQTVAATGWSAAVGTLVATQAAQTINAHGGPVVAGHLSVSETLDTIAAAGGSRVGGTLAVTETPDTLSAAGTVGVAAAPITFVGAADLGNNGGSGTLTASYTVGSGSNRVLCVVAFGASIPTLDPGMTASYAGITMSQANRIDADVGNQGPYQNRNLYFYYLLNPPSGTNNVVITFAHDYVGACAADYAGVNQSGPNATSVGTAGTGSTSVSVPLTVTVTNSWVVTGSIDYCTGNLVPSAGTNLTQKAYGAAFGEPQLCDSNGPEPTGTAFYQTLSAAGSYSGAAIIGVVFPPVPSGPPTGNLSVRQDDQTIAAAGTVPVVGIAYVDSVNLGNNQGAGGTYTSSYVVGSGANRLLCVVVMGARIGTADPGIYATYAGITMALAYRVDSGNAGSYNNRNLYFYYLVNPPSGRNDVVVYNATDWVIVCAADYVGVDQTNPLNTAYFAALGLGSYAVTVAVTPTVPNCWVVTGSCEQTNPVNAPGAGTNLTQRAYGTQYGTPQICDSNGPEAASTNFYQTTSQIASWQGAAIIGVAFTPFTVAYTGPTTGSLSATQVNQALSAVGGTPIGWSLLSVSSVRANGLNNVQTFPMDTTGADLLVVSAGAYNTPLVGTLSDSYGNSWSIYRYGAANLASIGWFWCRPTSVGPGHIFYWNGPNYGGIQVLAYQGSSANPLDQYGFHEGSITVQAPSITPSVNNALLVTAFCGSGNFVSVDSGFTLTSQLASVSGVSMGQGMATLVQPSAAPVAPTWVNDNNAGGQMTAAIISFKGSLTAAPSGTTGTLAITQASQTIAAAGGTTVGGTLAATQAGQTLIAAGRVLVSGALAVTQTNQTLSAAAAIGTSGSLIATQANQTVAATGRITVGGSLAATQASQTIVAAGALLITGGLITTQANETLIAAGGISVSGGLTAGQAGQTLVAAGGPRVGGVLTATQAGQTIIAAGSSQIVGGLTVAQANEVLSGSGTVLSGLGGGLNVSQAPQTLAGAATVTGTFGTLSVTQTNQTIGGTGTVQVRGTLTVAQAAQTLVATGTPLAGGTLAVTQAAQTLAATGTPLIGGTLATTQANQTLVAAARSTIGGTLTLTQASETLSATGSVVAQVVTGGLTVTQAAQTLSAFATGPSILGTLAVTQVSQTLAAAAAVRVAGAFATTQANQTLSATAIVPLSGALNLTQADQTLIAAGGIRVTGSLSLTQADQTLVAAGSIFVRPGSDINVDVPIPPSAPPFGVAVPSRGAPVNISRPGVSGSISVTVPARGTVNVPVTGRSASDAIVDVPI
jgi:hypothetical protein